MNNNYLDFIEEYLRLEVAVLQQLDRDEISKAIKAIEIAYRNGKTIYVFGNGGSSATASHFQNDFNKGISEYLETKFNFVCLNDNIPTLMAIANDIGFDEVFRFQLKGHLKSGDLVLAISGSGNSKNVINAVEYAKGLGNKIIGLTGFSGGKLAILADINLNVPIQSMQITEDVHMIFDHLMMSFFYKYLASRNHILSKKKESFDSQNSETANTLRVIE